MQLGMIAFLKWIPLMVVFDRVTKIYPTSFWGGRKEKLALNDFSFEAHPGQVTGLIGPNGAGKTTTFRIIAGLEQWNAGNVMVQGQNAKSSPEHARKLVRILLERHGFPKMAGRHVLEQTGLWMGLSVAQSKQRAQQLIEDLQMQEFAELHADKYSRGQTGRMGIARMLIKPAPVLLFDEPTVGLDFASAEHIRSYIRYCADQGHTVLLSTHLLQDIRVLCHRLVGLEHAQNVSDDTLKQWMSAQEQQFIQSLQQADPL